MNIPHSRKPSAEIETAGGAYVRRRLTTAAGDERLPGDTLNAEEVAAIPVPNLRALINTGRLELWPKAPDAKAPRRPHVAAA